MPANCTHESRLGLPPLMHLQLRVLEKTDFEKRLAEVEAQVRAPITKHPK